MNIKTLLIALLFSLPALSLQAQEPIRERQVPPSIREDFNLRFHEAENVRWLRQGKEYYGAHFKIKEAEHEAVYDADGNWQQTQAAIEFFETPDSAQNWCRASFSDHKVKETFRVSTRSYGILYDILLARENERMLITFDQHGKVLKRKQYEVTEAVAEAEEKKEEKEEEAAEEDPNASWRDFFKKKNNGDDIEE